MEILLYWAVVLTGVGKLTATLFRIVERIERPGEKREASRAHRNI